MHTALYADDLVLWSTSANMYSAHANVNISLRNLWTYCNPWKQMHIPSSQWGPVTFNAPDGAGTQLRYSPLTTACLRLRCHRHF